ncbi:hypothetical protein SOVF_164330 [Spinacia oleracea]|uniref:Actin cytoskeleton-regulatory complex protein PAN1 n=1 Tax=Spinacia oleracea TaxID=3562 RepID=A0A9R0J4S8_SPIOL|nr:actin cytoskeleton-regulatory complex protein PAN1 [Spinacia oleracea]KNA08238.1 hypothetical protein SOVF_164330 [Spinacia oleracea]
MGSTFNPQILVEKLTKLNNSQQSIETLSHWCIFHMNKAKLVVETWDRQYHSSPREQRLAFLYLANDILQNSRRKGAEFVAEFWRVLPEALRDVIRNGDDFGKNAARRLINIWDERKVFGSRGHILKEEFVARQPENIVNKSGKQLSIKFRQSIGIMFDKIISDYETIYGGQLDEDALLSRCTNTVSCLEKLIKDNSSGISSGNFSGSGFAEEFQGQHAALRECIEQLTTLEASRASLVSHLRDALQEQELKLDQVRRQLQAAQLQSDQVANVSQQFVSPDSNIVVMEERVVKDDHGSLAPPGFTSGDRQANPVVYTRQVPVSDKSAAAAEDDSRKSAAAAVAAKLTASTASAEMLSHVLTSLVSGVAFGNSTDNDPHHSDKRPKLENEASSYASAPPPLPPQNQQPPSPLTPFPHPESLQQNQNQNANNSTPTNQQSAGGEQPPLPSSSPPPLPPLPPMPLYPMPPQFIQTAGSMSNVAYSYGATLQPPPLSGYPSVTGMSPYAAPPVNNPYQPFPGSESGFYSPSSSVPMAPISRQQTL